MGKIRVLVVDDSSVVRRLVSDVISADPQLEVAGTAPNGSIALQKIPLTNPDVLTLDVEMPEMDGLETLTALRRTHPRLPVLMLSSLTERGAAATIECLYRGANDYVTKPAGSLNPRESAERLRDQLIPRIKLFCPRPLPQVPVPVPVQVPPPIGAPRSAPQRVQLV